MAKETSTDISEPASEDRGSAADRIERVKAQLGSMEGETSEGQDEGAQSQRTALLSGEHEVDWGDGAVRKVKIEDLVLAAKAGEEAKQLKELAAAEMAEVAQLRQLGERIGEMSQAQIQALQNFLQDPDQFVASTTRQNGKKDDGEDELDMDEMIRGPSQKSSPERDARLDRLEQGFQAIAKHLEGDLQARQKASLSDRVRTAMSNFPVFKEVDGLDEMAEESILNTIQAHPQADLDKVVHAYASRSHKMLMAARKGVVEERTGDVRTTPEGNLVLPKDFKPTGDALMNRDLLRVTEALFRQ